ncbi:E2 domain-containing protein, partial [Psychrobacter sp. AOP29-E1-7]
MPSLNDLEQYLNAAGIASKKDNASTLCFVLNVPMTSGKRKAFELTATQSDSGLLIKESGGCLPNFCPNRHINMGGDFCLGFEIEGLPIHDWVSYIKDYLRAQEYVNKHRKWPKQVKEWSHEP